MVTYGTTVIPSDQIEVISGSTVDIGVAFEASIGLVGGMDTANGTATPGDVVEVTDSADAASKFGDGSELHEQVKLAYNNGASTVYCLPVEETSTSESISGSGTLSNAPVMDPNVNGEHDITDGNGNTVNVSYNPSGETVSGTEAYVNPVDGTVNGDGSTSYDISYTHGDYSTTALQPLLDESPRIVAVCTENETVVNDLASELNSRATNFDFMQSVAGVNPLVTSTGSYTDSVDERRASLVYPSRGFTDEDETNQVRVHGAVGGYLAALDLGLSSTNDEISGIEGLLNDLAGPSEAGNLIDEEVMPLLDYPPVTIVSDQTTSTEAKFGRVYAMQVIDEATELSHIINRNFVGEQNTDLNQAALRRAHRNVYNVMKGGTPRMLDDFAVNVETDPNDDNQVNVSIGIDVVNVMDTIDVTITVGDVVRGNTQT